MCVCVEPYLESESVVTLVNCFWLAYNVKHKRINKINNQFDLTGTTCINLKAYVYNPKIKNLYSRPLDVLN